MPEPDPRRARLAELRQRIDELGRMVSAATGNPWGRGKQVALYKELQRRGGAAAAGPISDQFEGAAAEAAEGGTFLLAKSSTVFNSTQVEGDTPPSGLSRRAWRCGWRALSALSLPPGR